MEMIDAEIAAFRPLVCSLNCKLSYYFTLF